MLTRGDEIRRGGDGAEYVTLLPGELARLPRARRGAAACVVRVLSGTVWLTHAGNDEVLWPGESMRLEPQNGFDARRYGPTLVSVLGGRGAAIELGAAGDDDAAAGKTRGPGAWRTERRRSGSGSGGASAAATGSARPTIWNRLRARFAGRPTAAANPCASTGC